VAEEQDWVTVAELLSEGRSVFTLLDAVGATAMGRRLGASGVDPGRCLEGSSVKDLAQGD